MSESSTPVPASIPEPLLSECRKLINQGEAILAAVHIRKEYDLGLADAVRLLESSLTWKLGTRLEPQADGSVVVSGPPVALTAGRYFYPDIRRFGHYTPSYGDSMGEAVGYFATERVRPEDGPGSVVSMTNADARERLVKPEQAYDTTLHTLVEVVPFSDVDDVVILPPGWSQRMLDDPNFKLTPEEQAKRLIRNLTIVHGVALDDPALTDAVMHAANDNDGAAMEDIARRFSLSAVEAEQVLHALLGEGERPAGCFLDAHGRLKLMAPESEILDEIQEVHEVTPSLRGFTLTMPSPTRPSGVRSLSLDEIDEVFSTLDEERRQTGEDLESYADTLSWMRAEIGRLDAIESAFTAVNELCPPSDWLRDLKAAMNSTAEALTAVRDRANQTRTALDRAAGEQAALPFAAWSDTFTIPEGSVVSEGASGYEIEVRIPPGGFTTPVAPARPKVEVFDEPAPDWLPEGWTYRLGTYSGPDSQVFLHGHGYVAAWGPRRAHRAGDETEAEADRAAFEREKKALVLALAYPDRVLNPPTFAGLAELRADGFLQELNRLVLHPTGRALALTLDDAGRVLDVSVNRSPDPAGWGFIPSEDDAEFQANAANVAREVEAHRRARLGDPDLGSVVERVPGEGPRWESVARDPDEYDLLNTVLSNLGLYETYEAKLVTLLGKSADPEADAAIRVLRAAMIGETENYTTLRTRAESFLLTDRDIEPTPFELGAHEAAMAILRGEGDKPDPRVTMRGEIEQGRTAIAGLMELLGQRVVADGERSIAQMSACAYLSQAIEAHPGALNFLEDGWTWIDDSGEPRTYVATVQRIEGQTPGQMITGLKAENARLQAILDAETGRKGLPGWAYRVPLDEGLPYWEMYTKDARGAASVKIGGRLVVIFGSGMKATRVEGAVNALHGMELAEAELRRFGLMAPE